MASVFDRLDRIEKNQTQGKREKRDAISRLDSIQPIDRQTEAATPVRTAGGGSTRNAAKEARQEQFAQKRTEREQAALDRKVSDYVSGLDQEQQDAYVRAKSRLEHDGPSLLQRVSDTVIGGAKEALGAEINAAAALYDAAQGARNEFNKENLSFSQHSLDRAKSDLAAMEEDNRKSPGTWSEKDLEQQRTVIQSLTDQTAAYGKVQRAQEGTARESYALADAAQKSSAADIERAKQGLSKGGQIFVDAGASMTQTAMDAAANLLTGGASMAPFAFRAFGGGTQQARQDNPDSTLGQQLAYGAASAAKEVFTEKMFNLALPFAKAYGGGVRDYVVEREIRKAVDRFAKTDAGKRVLGGVLTFGADAVSEGLEELIGDWMEWQMPRIYGGDVASAGETLESSLYDFLVGAASGAMGGVISPGTYQYDIGDTAGARQDAAMDNAYRAMSENGMFSQEADAAREQARDSLGMPQRSAERQGYTAPAEVQNNAQDGDRALLETAREMVQGRENGKDPLTEALSGGKRVNQEQLTQEQMEAWDTHNDVWVDAKDNVYQMDPTQHISQRTFEGVGDRKVNAFQFDHPELQSYYKQAAEQLVRDASLSIDAPKTTRVERGTQGKRYIHEILDTPSLRSAMDMGLSRSQVIQAAQDLIADNGQENNAAAKRLEFVLDDMLTRGYTTAEGESFGPNAAYISAKETIPGYQAEQRDALPIWDMEEAAQAETARGQDVQQRMERVRRAAGALGESGGKALTAAYTEDTAKTIAPKEAVEGFYRVYNAAMKGEKLTGEGAQASQKLPAHLRYAAQSAGQQDALRAKQAKFFGEKAGLVKDDSWRKAHLSSKTDRTLDALGKALGVQIKFAETVADGQANAQYGNGVITMALDAKDPVLTSVVHEAVHRIRETSPEAYNTLAEFVQQTMTAEGLDFNLSERARLYGTENVSDLTEEMVADAFGRVLGNEDAVASLVQEHRNVAQKVMDVLQDIVNAVKRVLNHQNLELTAEQRAAFQDLEGRMGEMERLFSDALGKAEAQNGQKNTAQEGGTAKFSIKETDDGKKYVQADRQVIFGDDPNSWSEQLEDYINGKIRRGENVELIGADGDILLLTATSAGKLSDDHTSDGRTMSKDAYEKKVNAAAHIDELAQVSTRGNRNVADYNDRHGSMADGGWNYRTSYFMDFDGKYYQVMISVALGADGKMVYNIGQMQERSTPQINGSSAVNSGAQRGSAPTGSISGTGRDVNNKKPTASKGSSALESGAQESGRLSTDRVAQNGKEVKAKYSLKEYTAEEKKQHVKDAVAYFGRTFKWAETGYITTDGKRLDFSGRHDGGPGGYRTVDHRDIRDALGDDYGGDDHSGSMVQFMGEGNIRISPESGGINLSVMPTKAQLDTLSDFISKQRGEVILDLDAPGGDTVSSTEYPRGTHANKVLADIKAYFEEGKRPYVSELAQFRYSLKENNRGRKLTEAQQEYFKDSKVVDEQGRLKIMYRGGNSEFTVFDRKKSSYSNLYGRGFYFTDSEAHAKQYGNAKAFYLNITTPVSTTETTITRDQMRKFLKAVAANEDDFSFENYGYDAKVSSVLKSVYGKSDFAMLYDVNQTAIGDMVAAVELFNEVNGTSYDGLILDTETVAFRSDQIKNIDNQNPTKDPDIRYSRSDRELLSDYVKKYGAIPRGEKPSREITMPKKTGDGKNLSRTVRTILEAGATPEAMVPNIEKLAARGDFSYDAYTDKQAISDAESQIKKVGWAQALMDWTKAVKSGEVSKANTAMGWALYNNAANSGDTKTALTVLNQMVEHQRSAAQALQATRILKSMSPETQLYGVQRSVENLQEELNKRYGDKKGPELKIDEDLAERFMKAKDQESRDELLKEIYRDIGRQMPSRFIDRWNAWRYLAMLGNTRTHVRNIVGNAGFMPVVATKNLVGTAIESAVYRVSGGKLDRTKALVWGGKQDRALLSAAWGDYAKVQEAALGGGKYSDFANANRYIEEGRKIFGNTKIGFWNATGGKALETFRKANSAALDVEDVWFSKPHYAYALSQYCKAHGITAEQIAGGKGLKAAREYAILEAQKATYRDTNALSQAISELGRSSRTEKNKGRKAVATIMEGILPFRKTPANILARGVEYSPIGLANGIKEALWDVQKGTKTGAEAIDAISAGLSGTGLLALGLYMAAQGLVRGHGGDDDKKKKFEELQGHQAYALELPDGRSVTLDWLAPEALPFFIGVNLWEETGGERATLSDWMTSTKLVTEPLLEMSCLQSLNAVFDAVGYASSEGLDGLPAALASAGTSYLTQALPTVLGQAERTGEDKRYTTYTEKNAFLTGDIQYTLGKASARIPGWDYQQIPYIDAWGRTESSGNAGTRAFNNFVNPAYTSQIQNSAMEKELLRLYEATGESGVFPQRAEKYFTVDQERKDLTAQEYVKYAELKGQTSYQLVTDLVKDKKYQAMSDQDKVAAVENAYKLANQQAKQKVGGYKPESWIIKAEEAEKKHGIDQETYILLKTQTAGIESLKDKDGETISNSKGLQIMELVYGYTGLSDKQKEAMFEYLGVGKTIRHYNPGKVKQELEKMKKK